MIYIYKHNLVKIWSTGLVIDDVTTEKTKNHNAANVFSITDA